MKAILTYTTMIESKAVEQTRIFDTEKATKICDVRNGFGNVVQTIYLSKGNMLFIKYANRDKLSLPASQNELKKWIGENEPDKYIKFFGEVEEG